MESADDAAGTIGRCGADQLIPVRVHDPPQIHRHHFLPKQMICGLIQMDKVQIDLPRPHCDVSPLSHHGIHLIVHRMYSAGMMRRSCVIRTRSREGVARVVGYP